MHFTPIAPERRASVAEPRSELINKYQGWLAVEIIQL
jgi:hypothetical protein